MESRSVHLEKKVLEINLISAQSLKSPSANIRRLQTYGIVYINPSIKLRSRIDRVGGENPTWNDKFLFKVTPEFLARETSGVSFEIYAVGCLRDPLIGTVHFLVNNTTLSSPDASGRLPSFIALQVRRPSGRFQGVLNIGAMLNDGSELTALKRRSAVGYRDLMGKKTSQRPPRVLKLKKSVSLSAEEDLCAEKENNNYSADSGDLSDGGDSTTSSSSSTASTVLKDWNTIKDWAGSNLVRSASDSGGLFCGLLNQRRFSLCLSDLNSQSSCGSHKEKQ